MKIVVVSQRTVIEKLPTWANIGGESLTDDLTKTFSISTNTLFHWDLFEKCFCIVGKSKYIGVCAC